MRLLQQLRKGFLIILKHTLNPLTRRLARSSFSPFTIIRHVGRRTGKLYETPIIARPVEGGFVIELTYGYDVDWHKNVMAGGGCTLVWHGKEYVIDEIEPLDAATGRAAFAPLQQMILLMSLACRFSPRSNPVQTPVVNSTPTSSPATPLPQPVKDTPTAPASPEPPSLPAGESTRALTHDGRERSYMLYIPASVNWSQPVPLVFVLDGGTGNAENAARMSGFNEVAYQNGFIVVYPNGTGRLSDDKLLTWNGGACCGYAQEKNVDDVGFIRALVSDLHSLLNIDDRRIFATGMSNGGILSHRLACEAADVFAAIGPVAGTLNFPACNPSQPISVIEFHGKADQHLPYDGGLGSKSLMKVDFTSVQDSVGFWTTFNKCDSQPQTSSVADIRHETWTGCASSTAVELYTILGGGHAWPGGQGGFREMCL